MQLEYFSFLLCCAFHTKLNGKRFILFYFRRFRFFIFCHRWERSVWKWRWRNVLSVYIKCVPMFDERERYLHRILILLKFISNEICISQWTPVEIESKRKSRIISNISRCATNEPKYLQKLSQRCQFSVCKFQLPFMKCLFSFSLIRNFNYFMFTFGELFYFQTKNIFLNWFSHKFLTNKWIILLDNFVCCSVLKL